MMEKRGQLTTGIMPLPDYDRAKINPLRLPNR